MNIDIKISAIDLFCGAGGLTHGLIKSGINVVSGYDVESNCAYAYEANNKGAKFVCDDITNAKGQDLLDSYPEGAIKLLAGCAPCQPFSTYSQGKDASQNKSWPLLYQFSRLIKEINPEIVTMENVHEVTKYDVYHDFVNELESLGYNVSANKVFCPDYGVPQSRTRHVLLASKLGPISLIKPTVRPEKYKTVAQAFKNLPPVSAGSSCPRDPLHKAAGLTALNLKRIQHSRPGGSWREWPEYLVAECHKKESGKTYSGVYARMRADQPSPTMTTQCYGFGNGRFGHPEEDRAITLREAALLQTFPKNYKFVPPSKNIDFSKTGKLIGNAVPVLLGKVVGDSVKKHVGTILN